MERESRLRIRPTLALLVLASPGLLAQVAGPARMLPQAFRVPGFAPKGVAESLPLNRLPAFQATGVSIGLPLRNLEELAALRQGLHDPASPLFHQWLTPEAFTARFGPTAQDYARLLAWAQAKGLRVVASSPNRLVLNLQGAAADLEAAFQVQLRAYRHPSGRIFHAPDRAPTLDLDLAIASVNGLNDLLRPSKHLVRSRAVAHPQAGSGSNGLFLGSDFRKAYAAGVPAAMTGAGQGIALVEFSEYYPVDPANYWVDAGQAAPTLINVPVAGGATDYTGEDEASLDIEMAGAMAPAATLYVYEGEDAISILNRIVTDNHCKTVGCSWSYTTDAMASQTSIDPTQDAIFQQMDSQGIAFFVAAGDTGVWTAAQWAQSLSDPNVNPVNPSDVPTITCVGGTNLVTSAAGAWASETVWSDGGGGPSQRYPMPAFQTSSGIKWGSVSGASTTMRNCPDVAMVAYDIYSTSGNGKAYSTAGTSCAAPLWAAFAALANQTALAQGQPVLGNLNPILYALGAGASYGASLHDITAGNDGNPAAVGFDLASGWGSAVGQSTLIGLLGYTVSLGPVITAQPQTLTVTAGQAATFSVTATGTGALSYQWLANGNPVAGATAASYTVPVATLLATGTAYSVSVTDPVRTVTSQPATLMVIAKSLDLNGDGALNVLDLAALAAAYGTADPACELDGNGTVDDGDITLWLAGFGGVQ